MQPRGSAPGHTVPEARVRQNGLVVGRLPSEQHLHIGRDKALPTCCEAAGVEGSILHIRTIQRRSAVGQRSTRPHSHGGGDDSGGCAQHVDSLHSDKVGASAGAAVQERRCVHISSQEFSEVGVWAVGGARHQVRSARGRSDADRETLQIAFGIEPAIPRHDDWPPGGGSRCRCKASHEQLSGGRHGVSRGGAGQAGALCAHHIGSKVSGVQGQACRSSHGGRRVIHDLGSLPQSFPSPTHSTSEARGRRHKEDTACSWRSPVHCEAF